MKIPLVLHKDEHCDFGVCVPDLPGCFTAGTTVDEAIAMARAAIDAHIEQLLDHGDDIPELRPLEEHLANPAFSGGIWFLIDFDALALRVRATRYTPAPVPP